MAQNKSDGDAQMLAQIKALPKGEMKAALLDSFLKKNGKISTANNNHKLR